jgi:hypothetical protein
MGKIKERGWRGERRVHGRKGNYLFFAKSFTSMAI